MKPFFFVLCFLLLSGPTASGKTALALELAEKLSGEIINADVGQLFTPCSVGTAKPAWRSKKIPHHLFDIIDEPQDLSAATYRDRVLEKIAEIQKRGNRPLIVGGSLFYLKSYENRACLLKFILREIVNAELNLKY